MSVTFVSYLLEHGLKPDGRLDPDAPNVGEPGSFETFFSETRSGKWVPRSIFVDLDPSVRSKISQMDLSTDKNGSPLMRFEMATTVNYSILNF